VTPRPEDRWYSSVASIVLVMVPDVWAASRRPASISFAAAWIIAAQTAISQSGRYVDRKAPLAWELAISMRGAPVRWVLGLVRTGLEWA
jgi:hypothetical protein